MILSESTFPSTAICGSDPLGTPHGPPHAGKPSARKPTYLQSHASRSRYGRYQAQNWFIGSGVNEAGFKTVVARRLKQSGMFWSEPGAGNSSPTSTTKPEGGQTEQRTTGASLYCPAPDRRPRPQAALDFLDHVVAGGGHLDSRRCGCRRHATQHRLLGDRGRRSREGIQLRSRSPRDQLRSHSVGSGRRWRVREIC